MTEGISLTPPGMFCWEKEKEKIKINKYNINDRGNGERRMNE
jgi:hypothetical protein